MLYIYMYVYVIPIITYAHIFICVYVCTMNKKSTHKRY